MAIFKEMTPEIRALAMQAKVEKANFFRSRQHLLIGRFSDTPHWRRLASHYGVRMPSDYLPCSELKYVRRACRKLDLDYREVFDESVALFPKLNPDWPAYAHVGLVLEAAAERDAMEHVETPPEPTSFADVEDLI